MPNRGKLVVGSMLLVALGLAIFAWYWRWQQGHRAAEFWGAEVSELIRGARQTELLMLRPADREDSQSVPATGSQGSESAWLSIDGRQYAITETLNLANSPGLIHAQHSLTEDASFVWDDSQADCPSNWTHAMRLSRNDRSAVLAFDFGCRRLWQVEQSKAVSVQPRITEGFQRIFNRAAASQKKTDAADAK